MDAISLLHTRNSVSVLTEPAPTAEQVDLMVTAATRAPDHARLRPWRFLTIAGSDREALGRLFVEATNQRLAAAGEPQLDAAGAGKLAAKPLRAPLIIVAIASITEHPKVPEIEQQLSAGCAAHGILLAAHALGFGAIWRTGANAYDNTVERGLGLDGSEQIVGYIYIGTPAGYKTLPELDPAEFCQAWSATS